MHEVAVRVAQQLDLDMAGAADQFFQIDFIVAEGGLGFTFGGLHGFQQGVLGLDGAHAAPTAAPGGFEHDGVAYLRSQAFNFHRIVRQRVGGGHDGHADGDGQVAGGDLVAEAAHGVRRGADDDDALGGAGVGEVRVFGEEAVAGVDGVSAGLFGDADDFLNGEISLDGAHAAADQIRLVRLEPVQGEFVMLRVDGDGLNAKLGRRAHDADGDFRPVGDQKAFEVLHRCISPSCRHIAYRLLTARAGRAGLHGRIPKDCR